MSRRRIGFALFVLVTGAALFSPTNARAEDPVVESADGSDGCRAFVEKNDKELKAWEATQPAVPYKYPHQGTVLDAPWMPFFSWFGGNIDLMVATFVPAFGVEGRNGTPATTISWPISFQLGPLYSCTRKPGTFVVTGHRVHSILVEPGMVLSDQGIGTRVRPGYRFLYHPSDWVAGIGAGLGTTIELSGLKEPFRLSLGPELVVHLGHCCDRSYFTLALRYDYFAEGHEPHIFGANLAYTYF